MKETLLSHSVWLLEVTTIKLQLEKLFKHWLKLLSFQDFTITAPSSFCSFWRTKHNVTHCGEDQGEKRPSRVRLWRTELGTLSPSPQHFLLLGNLVTLWEMIMKASDDTAHHNGSLTQKATECKHTRDQGNAKSTSHQIAKQLDTHFFWILDTFFS